MVRWNLSDTSLPPDIPLPQGSDATDPVVPPAAAPSLAPPERASQVQLILDRALRGDGASLDNLCVVVGTIRATERRRFMTYAIAVQEALAGSDAVRADEFHKPLTMSSSLVARYADLLQDGQRVMITGLLRNDGTYDSRFATDSTDAGRRVWDMRLDVVAIAPALPSDPDYALVQVAGMVEQVTFRVNPIGRNAIAHYAEVLLRNTIFVQSAAPGARGRYRSTTLLPLQLSLEGDIAGADGLLRVGNTVQIEGRLKLYRVRRNPSRDVGLQQALERFSDNPRQQRRLLEPQFWAIDVGAVTLEQGTPLRTDERAAQMAAQAQRRRHTPPDAPSPDAVTAALSAATESALDRIGAAPEVDHAPPVESVRPRRRRAALADAPTDDHDGVDRADAPDGD